MGVQLSTTTRDLVRSTLFGKDFETNVNELVGFVQLAFGPEAASNIVASEQGQMLIEREAFGLSTLNWYGDRQADDTNLRDVRLRSAAVTIGRQLGYKAYGAVPATVTLTLTLDAPPTTTRLTLEKGRVLLGVGGLLFEMAEEVIFEIGEVGPKTFAAREGKSLEEIFTSNGEPNQFFRLETIPDTMAIAQGAARVFVNSLEWFEQALIQPTQTNEFELEYGLNPPRLQFGDGAAGNVPPANADIKINYLATSGPAGAVPSSSVLAFQAPLVAGTQVLTGTLVQPDPSTPGSDQESIASIKVNAPLVYQAAQRSVTQLDYDGLINSFVDPVYGAVAIGRATVPRGVDQDAEALTIIALLEAAGIDATLVLRLRTYWDKVLASNCAANVVIAQILAADSIGRYVIAPVGLARALETFLDARAESTVKVKVTDGSVNLLLVDLSVDLHLLAGYTGESVRESIRSTAAASLQAQLIGRVYGASLRISDLYQIIEAIEGVDWSNIRVTAVNGLTPTQLNQFGDLIIQSFQVISVGNPVVATLV